MGGQILPISILGDRDIWKNLQKNEKKKKISEIINKIIPNRIKFETFIVCIPWKVLSRITSRHHWIIFNNKEIRPIKNNFILNSWNHLIAPINKIIKLNEVNKGQGLTVTKWKGWLYLIIILFLFI